MMVNVGHVMGWLETFSWPMGASKYGMGAYGGQYRKYVFSAIFNHLWSQVSGCGSPRGNSVRSWG
jgi:hypothetical protein